MTVVGLINIYGLGVLLVLLFGYGIIYLIPTKHTDYLGPAIGLFSVCAACILAIYSDIILIDCTFPQIGEHQFQVKNLTFKRWLTLPLIQQLYIFLIICINSLIFQSAVFMSIVSPFLFLYLMLSENRFDNNKLGPITFLLYEAIAFFILGLSGQYMLVSSFAAYSSIELIIFLAFLFFVCIILFFLVFFTKHLWELDYQAKKKRTEDLLQRKRLRQKIK